MDRAVVVEVAVGQLDERAVVVLGREGEFHLGDQGGVE
jgi:hypothetical protein